MRCRANIVCCLLLLQMSLRLMSLRPRGGKTRTGLRAWRSPYAPLSMSSMKGSPPPLVVNRKGPPPPKKSSSSGNGTSIGALKNFNGFSYEDYYNSNGAESEEVTNSKAKKFLQKLDIDKIESDLVSRSKAKTGAELRKERKESSRNHKLNEEALLKLKEAQYQKANNITTTTSTSGSGVSSSGKKAAKKAAATRFVLGCGIEVLTATNLLDLVRSTAPYYFPDSAPRLVLNDVDDDDDDDEDDFKYLTSSSFSIKSSISEKKAVDTSTTQSSTTKPLVVDAASGSYLMDLAAGPRGWLQILRCERISEILPPTDSSSEQQRIDYFALCLASHFASVATYVPTDVDSKIRGHCWSDPSARVLRAQFDVVKRALLWDVESVSKRTLLLDTPADYTPPPGLEATTDTVLRPVSGHDGEFLGVLGGAWGAFLQAGEQQLAAEAEALISEELRREARAFNLLRTSYSSHSRPEARTAALSSMIKLASILSHNVGDLDQGLSYWSGSGAGEGVEAARYKGKFSDDFYRYSRLSHERSERFNGEFAIAKAVYKELVSAEGHRNYPLRDARCLRSIPELALPIGPWLEPWGRLVALHPSLSHEDRLTIIRQLIRGCDSSNKFWCVPGQVGYFRALSGIFGVINIDRMAKDLDKECATALKTHDMRLQLGVSEAAFAAKLGLAAEDVLEDMGL